MKQTEAKGYEDYIEDKNYRSLKSDDIKWYLEQKKDNDELKKVEHIAIDIDNDPYAKKNEKQILEDYKYSIKMYSGEQQLKAIKTVKLQEIVADKLFNHMKESFGKNGNKDFCKKLLISNTDGLHTYAFIYGFVNKEPFFITFSKNGDEVFKSVMGKSKKSQQKDLEKSFKDSLFGIYSIVDSKTCGTIALKIMKYLKYENIKEIMKNKNDYIINEDNREVHNIVFNDKGTEKNFSPHILPRKLVQYIQSIQHINHHDKYYDYKRYVCKVDKNNPKTKKADAGKFPGTVYNKIRSKNKIKLKDGKEVNTTAETKQKQIINKCVVNSPEERKNGRNGITTYR